MANIKSFLDAIKNAVYGREVRDSIINAISKINDDNESYQDLKKDVVDAKEYVDKKIETFDADSKVIPEKAEESKTAAKNAKESEINSKASETNAKRSEENASTDRSEVERLAEEVRSFNRTVSENAAKAETARNEAESFSSSALAAGREAASSAASAYTSETNARSYAQKAKTDTENVAKKALNDIESKTDEQLQRIPEVSKISEDVSRLSSSITEISNAVLTNVTSKAFEISNHILGSDGTITPSAKWKLYKIRKENVGFSISAKLRNVEIPNGLLAIGFYSSFDLSKSTFISGVAFSKGIEEYFSNINIPQNTVCIAICSRFETADDAIISTAFEFEHKEKANKYAFDGYGVDIIDGGLSGVNGTENTNTNRKRSPFIKISEKSIISLSDVFKCVVFRYSANKQFIDNTTGTFSLFSTLKGSDYLSNGCEYIRLLFDSSYKDNIKATFHEDEYLLHKITDAENLAPKNNYKGKYISFYGDSITTFEGWIPQGNRVEYTGNNLGVNSVEQTWWKKVVDHFGMNLLVNNSWSGRCVSNRRDEETSMINSAGARIENILQLKTQTKDPDIIIVRLGTNDFSRSVNIGSYDGSMAFPTDYTNFREAYAIMLDNIKCTFPRAEIWCCTVPYCKRASMTFPTVINGNSIVEFNKAIIEIADLFNCKVIRHDRCGFNIHNVDIYMGDNDTHPNADGMELIALETIREMSF